MAGRASRTALLACVTALLLAAAPAAAGFDWWRDTSSDGDGGGGTRSGAARAARGGGGADEASAYDDEGGGDGGGDVDAERPWSAYDRFKLVSVNGSSVGRALYDVLRHEFSISRPQLQRSLGYIGPHQRLRRLVAALLKGGERPFKVGVVGGSISYGHGASQQGSTDWFSLLKKWMHRAFPSAALEFHNGCVPATPAAFMTLCLEHYLDPLADLVFVEYVLNDGMEDRVAHNRRVRIYERLVRRILDQPHAPAVVLVNVGTHGMFHDREYVSDAGALEWRPFHHTLEDLYGAVAQYYSAPAVSFRNAIYNLGQAADYHFDRYLKGDFIHPNDAGHRIMADMMIYLIQEAAVGLMTWPLSFADDAAALAKLPDPMYPGNHPSLRRVCFHAEDFAGSVVSRDHGWEWVNEGTDNSPKWGYVSKTPGSVLKVRLDTSVAVVDPGALIHQAPLAGGGGGGGGAGSSSSGGGGGGGAAKPKHTAVVIFSYLKSYERMGKAEFRCEAGCSCKPRYADAFTDLPESTIYFVQLHATPSRNCTLAVINDSEPGGRDTKFKVTGVMVNMVSDATRDLNDADFAEDWPQYGVAGVQTLPKEFKLAVPGHGAKPGATRPRLKGRGRPGDRGGAHQ
ncbi:MAG: SGNH hydrolase-type esterase domain-containing protein [Monoraphidium minutum]|nr:MAG: SGNH hydrolase-type esterase domain-containing protein [Monoraphidium minutum]